MNDPLEDARYAPPQSHVEDVHQAGNGLPGQRASRRWLHDQIADTVVLQD